MQCLPIQICERIAKDIWMHQEAILKCGLTSTIVNNESHFKCILSLEILTIHNMNLL